MGSENGHHQSGPSPISNPAIKRLLEAQENAARLTQILFDSTPGAEPGQTTQGIIMTQDAEGNQVPYIKLMAVIPSGPVVLLFGLDFGERLFTKLVEMIGEAKSGLE